MAAFLLAADGRDAHGRDRVPLRGPLTVGRHPSNGLVLDHDGASRHHALVEHDAGAWWVSDLDSKNGTTLDGAPVRGRRELSVGVLLRFGGGPGWTLELGADRELEGADTRTASLPGARRGLTLIEEGGQRRVTFSRLLTIGRHPGNGLVLDHDRISGHHAVIGRRGRGWYLRDLGSRNGTTVDGRRTQGWRELRPGNRVQLGGCCCWQVTEARALDGSLLDHPHTAADIGLPRLRMTLAWDGEDGLVRVEHQGASWVEPAGQTFLLLWELAGSPGEWVPDARLKEAIWGAQAERRGRTALNTAIYNARKLFARHGLPAAIIEKDPTRRGRTRLCLPAEAVERVGAR